MSSVKMFECVSQKCQLSFALERALKCLHFTMRKHKPFGHGILKEENSLKEELFERI
jgi:hypothetical protein